MGLIYLLRTCEEDYIFVKDYRYSVCIQTDPATPLRLLRFEPGTEGSVMALYETVRRRTRENEQKTPAD
jgi:hypothetical protein